MAELFDKVKITSADLDLDESLPPEDTSGSTSCLAEEQLEKSIAELLEHNHIFEEAGYVISCIEAEMSDQPKLIPHFRRVHSAGRAEQERLTKRQSDKPMAALVLNSLLKAQTLVQKTQPNKLQFAEVVIELASPPSVRVVWKEEISIITKPAVSAKIAVKNSKKITTEAKKPVTAQIVGTKPSKPKRAIPVARIKTAEPSEE